MRQPKTVPRDACPQAGGSTARTAPDTRASLKGRMMEDDGQEMEERFELSEHRAAYWLSMDGWTFNETMQLLCGIDPRLLPHWVEAARDRPDLQLPNEYQTIRSLLQRADEVRALIFPAPPADVLSWAMGKSLEIPESLMCGVPRYIGGRRLWKLSEAVRTVTAIPGFGALPDTLTEQATQAGYVGKLVFREVCAGGPVRSANMPGFFDEYLFADDFNRWLKRREFPELYRIADGPQINTLLKPVPLQRAQEAAILAKLAEFKFDAQALPPAPSGKQSAAKQAVKAALGYTDDVMNKAWMRLRSDGRIQNTHP